MKKNPKEVKKKPMEVLSVAIIPEALMTKKDGQTVPYIALEFLGRDTDGKASTTLYAFPRDVMANFIAGLTRALEHSYTLPPESTAKH